MSDIRCHVSYVICHMSNVKCQMSDVRCQMSNILYNILYSDVRCQMSDVWCQMSRCVIYFFTALLQLQTFADMIVFVWSWDVRHFTMDGAMTVACISGKYHGKKLILNQETLIWKIYIYSTLFLHICIESAIWLLRIDEECTYFYFLLEEEEKIYGYDESFTLMIWTILMYYTYIYQNHRVWPTCNFFVCMI